jgi:hypothetical protein
MSTSSDSPSEAPLPPLPPTFWAAPEGALGDDPTFSLIHAEVVSRLKAEILMDDTLEMMLVERVAFLYCHIRYKESKKLFAHDRAYKETLQLWTGLAADLRKFRAAGAGVEAVRDQIFASMERATAAAVKTLPKEIRSEFIATLSREMRESGV